MITQAALKMNSTIHSAVGFSGENEPTPLKVAMAMKPVRRKMNSDDRRSDCAEPR